MKTTYNLLLQLTTMIILVYFLPVFNLFLLLFLNNRYHTKVGVLGQPVRSSLADLEAADQHSSSWTGVVRVNIFL